MENMQIKKACEYVQAAINYDNAGDLDNALSSYQLAIQAFIGGIKYERIEPAKKKYEEKTQEYMTRAEEIKKAIEARNNPTTPKGGSAATVTKKPDDKDSEDSDNKKRKEGLASAVVSEKPNIKWDDVAGLEQAKEALKEAVILPIRFPQLFVGKRKPWKGILLYGPPGTGKSFLAKAVATEADSTFFSVSSSDLVSKWQGESEKMVRGLFEIAREQRPSIIFIDEIDSLCSARGEGQNESSRRILTEFLVQMDGVGHSSGGLLVLGATNVPWELDGAIRRRFEKRVYIALPDAPARSTMFKLNLGTDTPHELEDHHFEMLGAAAEGYSGSDISVLVREAIMEPLRKCQMAKQFMPDPMRQHFFPCEEYPNCPSCPLNLSAELRGRSPYFTDNKQCQVCFAERKSLYDIPSDQLVVPKVIYKDFEKALTKAHGSVGADELDRFVSWTEEFGQEG